MVERVNITGSRFLTRNASGAITFDSNKTYIRTNSTSGIVLELLKPGFAITNPIDAGGTYTFAFGNYAGFVAASPPISNPSSVGILTLPAFPVDGYWRVRGTQCTDGQNDPAGTFVQTEVVFVNFDPWNVYRVSNTGTETFLGSLQAVLGGSYYNVDAYSGSSSTSRHLWIGAGYPAGNQYAGEYVYTVAAMQRLRLKPYQNISSFTYTGPDPNNPYSTTQLPYPSDGYVPGNCFLLQWFAYDKTLPLEFTV